jgi:hypothetical protein
MIRKILSLPEPERTNELESLSETLAIDVYSSKEFPVYYRNKIEKVKKGKNTFSKNFAIYLLRKYAELSETPLDGSQTSADETHSPYFEKLVAIKGIGEKSAEEIKKAFPTPAELIEAAKSDRLPDQLARFKDTFLEVFK